MVEVAHGVKVPSCRRQVCSLASLLADTFAEPRQLAVELCLDRAA
jgi:hypothetical protein